jgi:hypothetical protein
VLIPLINHQHKKLKIDHQNVFVLQILVHVERNLLLDYNQVLDLNLVNLKNKNILKYIEEIKISVPADSKSCAIERVIKGSADGRQRSANFKRFSLGIKTPCQTDLSHASQLIITCPRRVSLYAKE